LTNRPLYQIINADFRLLQNSGIVLFIAKSIVKDSLFTTTALRNTMPQNTTFMKKYYTLIAFLILTWAVQAQPMTEKTFVKSFNFENQQEILLDLAGDVEIQQWSNSLMRVQITIALPNGTEAMLKSLIRAGRYNLQAQAEDGHTLVQAPNLLRKVTVGGKELQENISYTVFAPKNLTVKLAKKESASSTATSELSSSL